MSKLIDISSAPQLGQLVKSSRMVIAYFYAESAGDAWGVLPTFETLAASMSQPRFVAFAKVNVDQQSELKSVYDITTPPIALVFRLGQMIERVKVDPRSLQEVIQQIVPDVENAGAGASGGDAALWLGADLPRGYKDVTDQIEIRRCELLNVDSDAGGVRALFASDKPSALAGGQKTGKDWVESDTDEQLMLFTPFTSMIKLHTLQITSLPPADEEEAPMRPLHIKLYSNKPHNLGFDEAESTAATQEIELSDSDWNANGTASIKLRFVKFQNINSLVMFVVSGDGDSEKVRIDRVRLIGETGEKRDMGKLEKIGDEPGE